MQADYDDLVHVEAYNDDLSTIERLECAVEAFYQAMKR